MGFQGPPINSFNPLIQELLSIFEQSAFPDGGFEECDDAVGRLYNENFKRPYVCALVADVLSGRWGLGATQEDVSQRLGLTDRSWVSRALRRGDLSLDIYLRLKDCPSRPSDWEPSIDGLRRDMERSAFIGVARFFAGYISDRPTLVPQRLNEWNCELLWEILDRLATRPRQLVKHGAHAARQLIRDVSLDPRRNVCPSWYVERERRQVQEEIHQISDDPDLAYAHLGQLQRDWLDIFVGAHTAIDSIKWVQP